MDRPKELTFAEKSAVTFNLLHCAGRPLFLLFGKNLGKRHAGNNLNAAWSLGIIGVFWMYHEAMGVAFVLALVAEISQRARPGKGVGSYFIGQPVVGGDWKAVGAVAVAAGVLAFQEPEFGPVGAWLILAGIGVLSTVTMARRRAEMIDDDLQDAIYEQRMRSMRMRQLEDE